MLNDRGNFSSDFFNLTKSERIDMRYKILQQLRPATNADINNLKLLPGLLSATTSITTEMNKDSFDIAVESCENLLYSLKRLSKLLPSDVITEISTGISGAITNAMAFLSKYEGTNGTEAKTLTTNYGGNDSQSDFFGALKRSEAILNGLTGMVSLRLAFNQTATMESDAGSLKVKKILSSDVTGLNQVGKASFSVPEFCKLVQGDNCNKLSLVVQVTRVLHCPCFWQCIF